VSGNQPTRRKKKAPETAKGKGGGGGGQRGRKRGKKKSNESAIDPKRPLWENPDGEAEVRGIVGSVRPAHRPTAVVRSLGDPPLGKYASNAPHYYDAVYQKAQHFAVAIAKANNLRVLDEFEDSGAEDSDREGAG
jgi:hypothetical protein